MDKNEKIDEIDKLLLEYFKNETNNEKLMPPSTKRVVQKVIKRVKVENTIRKFNKVAAIFITIGIMTTGIVFAKDIVNFITSLFTNSTPAIDTAVENGYVQNIDMDYVYSNSIGIKVEALVIDNSNLNVSFIYKNEDTTLNSIILKDYIITTDNKDIIYDSKYSEKDKGNLASVIVRNENPIKVDNETFKESILFNFIKCKDVFENIFININKLKIIKEDDSIEYITGDWNFNIDLSKRMLENNEIEYITSNQDIAEELHAVMTATGLTIKMKSSIPINLEIFDYAENFMLENSVNEKFVPYFIENGDVNFDSNIENGIFTIHYNNISTYSDEIDELVLHLNINGKIEKIKLSKKASN